ncbi:ATP-binding protein [Hymenobacter chitinivorans]|uniref:Tetratricopeptide repeat protein n=1 Tax=Hymenobacter chitinivorans DSM 11115 TaxID=1121954 RepID=A0A2M9BLT1_9BACT|nr:AAA family ATPase [Hymenobacter chitinivorans]PJJ58880.1 tetratricopeptide repeat protein [Hymenobacter chitinivorans DSM 11115]
MAALPNPSDLQPLLDALAFSPENVPLRRHVATLLRQAGRLGEAEEHYRTGLRQAPDDVELQLGLAETYAELQKTSAALVVLEELLRDHPDHARAHLLHARLLARAGGPPDEARAAYQQALQLDGSLRDPALDEQLGLRPAAQPAGGGAPADYSASVSADYGIDERALFAGLEKPKITFQDVGGMDAVKEEIRLKIIHPLQFPDLYKAYGKAAGGGLLLYGPPGCGKTHLARATAGEVKASFIHVGINDILDMWMGQSEKKLHDLFELARVQAPCVLFFDEVDALAANRHDLRQSAGRTLINQFLEELDGARHSNDGVLILAATNAPWHLDPAFRRPGRFDRIVLVTPPDEPAREAILEVLLRGKPVAPGLNLKALAAQTAGLSGADLQAVVDVAVEACLRESMKAGKPLPVQQSNLLAAAKQVKPSTKEWFATAKNYALYSNEGGNYDDILTYLGIKK